MSALADSVHSKNEVKVPPHWKNQHLWREMRPWWGVNIVQMATSVSECTGNTNTDVSGTIRLWWVLEAVFRRTLGRQSIYERLLASVPLTTQHSSMLYSLHLPSNIRRRQRLFYSFKVKANNSISSGSSLSAFFLARPEKSREWRERTTPISIVWSERHSNWTLEQNKSL